MFLVAILRHVKPQSIPWKHRPVTDRGGAVSSTLSDIVPVVKLCCHAVQHTKLSLGMLNNGIQITHTISFVEAPLRITLEHHTNIDNFR